MDKASFAKLIAKVFTYFQSVKMPNDQQLNLWYEQISFIPNGALQEIESQIYKNNDGLPRNLPKAIREAYSSAPRQNRPTDYDPIEDFSYPVSNMHKALDILIGKGDSAFVAYANQTRMPCNDRDRVRFKAEIITKKDNSFSLKNLLKPQYDDSIPF